MERLNRTFQRKGIAGEIVLVNDGSRDDTGAVIDELARQYPNVVAIHHPVNRGIEAGWRSGLQAARGIYVCFIDADLQHLPEDVYRLLREIQLSHVDLVQGYRSSVGRLKDSRYILSKGLNFILNTLFGMNLRDNKCGFVISRKEVLEDILPHRYRYRYFQTFITVSATAKGYTIRSIETLFESRLLGESFLSQVPRARGAVVLRRPPEGARRVPLRAQAGEHPGGVPGREPAAAARSRARRSGAGSGWSCSSSPCRCTSG